MRQPVVAAACLLAAFAVHALVRAARFPFPFPGHRTLGALILLAGLTLSSVAVRHFRRRGTTVEPFGTPTALVSSGPYRFSRNPMYVGIVLTLSGIALLVAMLPFALAALAFFAVINARQIPLEESRLSALFGDSYGDYRRAFGAGSELRRHPVKNARSGGPMVSGTIWWC